MVAADYTKNRALAARMINKYGRKITLINKQGPNDPTKPLRGPKPDIVVQNVMGVFVRPSGYIKLGESFYLDPGLWDVAEKIVLVLASLEHDFAKFTNVKDTDGSGYKIFKVEELRPGDVPILVYLGLRQ